MHEKLIDKYIDIEQSLIQPKFKSNVTMQRIKIKGGSHPRKGIPGDTRIKW